MSLKALFYAYVLGGLTFLPLVILAAIFYTIYTSVPVGDPDPAKFRKRELERQSQQQQEKEDAEEEEEGEREETDGTPQPLTTAAAAAPGEVNDLPRVRKGWLTVRRTFEESTSDASYVDMVRGFLDARSKDPKRSRPKDTWYVALKGKVLYLYEDESMTECEAAIELSGHDVVVCPEGLLDGELFAKRNAICLKPKVGRGMPMPSVTRDMRLGGEETAEELAEEKGGSMGQKQREMERLAEEERGRDGTREQVSDVSTPWFIFVRSAVEMEDWYLAMVHASDHPANSPTLEPLKQVYHPDDMAHLVTTLDAQPDVIPMRWLNALLGRIFFSYYRTQTLESYIIGRLMKKISKVKRPAFLTDIIVREVNVGNKAPTLSKPMLKELTKEGDASLEVHMAYKGEVRVTVEATATINLGARFKTYVVKLVLALVVREIEGNLLVKVKRPPSSRIWYAFTQMPRIVMDVEPVVSDRQITWSMILSTIESKVKEVIYESVVLPNMDDISFFESFPYKHRGGIWGDASRHERAQTTLDEQPPALATERHSMSSAPPSEAARADLSDSEVSSMPRSHSAEEIEKTPTGTSPPDLMSIARATTVDASTPTVVGTPPTKRRPWFTNTQDEVDALAPPALGATLTEERVSRGRRSLPPDAEYQRNVASSSEIQDDMAQFTETDHAVDDEQHLSPTPSPRRPASQHSRPSSSRTTSVSSSHGGDYSDDAPDVNLTTYRSKSPAPSGSSRQTPNSPTSFFQTLKSRAADKQALSNTAKEAMRKWGVNWSNFRRETLGNSGNGNGAPADEVADGGHGDSRRIESATSTARPSYADVRVVVEERREKDRAPLQEASSRSNQSASVPIPMSSSNEKGKETAVSVSSSNEKGKETAVSVSPANAFAGASPASTGAVNVKADGPRSASPIPLVRTETQVSSSSHRSASQVLGVAPEEEERPSSPIHTQPLPPKTMAIPGIHASHRGEIMSMGYAPPPPLQEAKKAPLQGVYRLWKAPATSEPAPLSQTGFTGRDQDLVTQVPPPPHSVSEIPPQPPRPIPPPLPPRANSTHVLLTTPEITRPTETGSLSQASAALQSIVTKDRVKRASLTPPSSAPSSPGQDLDRSGADDQTNALDGPEVQVLEAAAVMTPNLSTPPSPSPTGANGNGRGLPPALPPRRLRTSA